MAVETWVTTVDVRADFASFPSTGQTDRLYCDQSTATQEDLSDAALYYWNGTSYSAFIGHRPRRPH